MGKRELDSRRTRNGFIIIFTLLAAWGIFTYLLLYHGWIFGIH